jgi:hypothetical protein
VEVQDEVTEFSPRRSRRWLQLLILLAGGAFLWLIYRVVISAP